MSRSSSRNLDRFLRALRLRAGILHAAETGGVGLLIAAAAGVILVAAMAARHLSAELPMLAILAVGAVSGAMIGLWRRPSVLQVATEADRQLHLPELLSSAALLPPAGAADAFDRALRSAVADRAAEACGRRSSRQVRFRRFGVNRWIATALAAGVPVLLATLASPPAQAVVTQDAPLPPATTTSYDNAPLVELADSAAGPRQEMNPDEIVHGGTHQESNLQAADPPASTDAGNRAGPALAGNDANGANGAGSARTHVEDLPQLSPGMDLPTAGSQTTGTGTDEGGAGPASSPLTAGDADHSEGVGRTLDAAHAPPWASGKWAAESASARGQVDSGQIPPAYRDLVRDYFSSTGNE